MYTSPIHGETWGGLLVDNLLGINGYCVPALTETEEGLRVFVANEVGRVQDFGLFTGDWDADLVEVDDNVLNLQPGFRAAAAFADLNEDGLLDGLIGIQNGGVLAFQGSEGSTETLAETSQPAFTPRGSCPTPDKMRFSGLQNAWPQDNSKSGTSMGNRSTGNLSQDGLWTSWTPEVGRPGRTSWFGPTTKEPPRELL